MTPQQFRSAAVAVTRTALGWQTKIARTLGVQSRTVRRWLVVGRETGIMPDAAVAAISEAMGEVDTAAVWPRGEWLVGRDDGGRLLVQHLHFPRFTARAVHTAPGGATPAEEEQPADILSGVVYVADGGDPEGDALLCEIAWIDEPSPGEVTQMMEAAADAWEAWENRA